VSSYLVSIKAITPDTWLSVTNILIIAFLSANTAEHFLNKTKGDKNGI